MLTCQRKAVGESPQKILKTSALYSARGGAILKQVVFQPRLWESLVEPLGVLCVLVVALPLIAVVGHGLWLLVAGDWKTGDLKSELQPQRDSAPPKLSDDLTAAEILATRLELANVISADTAAQLKREIAAHCAKVQPPPLELAPGASPSAVTLRLRSLMVGFPHIESTAKANALRVFDALEDGQRSGLPADLQFDVARLLVHSGRVDDALRTYRRILNTFGDSPGCAATALEGARLAIRVNKTNAARYFLNEARGRLIDDQQQEELTFLTSRLPPIPQPRQHEPAPAVAEESETNLVETPDTYSQPTLLESPSQVISIAPSEVVPDAPSEIVPEPPNQTLPEVLSEPVPEVQSEILPDVPSEALPVAPSQVVSESPELPPIIAPPPRAPEVPAPAPAADIAGFGRSSAPARPANDSPPISVWEAPPKPAAPRRSFGEVLLAFMEERNIRWGELLGGLLIVGCSIMLVLSLWETLERIEYFQFFIFVGVTSAVFGAGLYTHHRWKLRSTSQGLLIIATLLVPLTFLAMIGTSKSDTLGAFALVTEIGALAIFVALVGQAAKVLAPPARWWMTAVVVASSGCLLVIPRALGGARPGVEPSPWLSLLLALAPVGLFVAATLGVLRRTRGNEPAEDRWTAGQAQGVFIFLGTSVFAVTVALGLVGFHADRAQAIDWLAAPIDLVAVGVLIAGLAVMRGVGDAAAVGHLRVAGTAVALTGAAVMLVALGLAWPHPAGLLAIGLLNAGALAYVALRYDLPMLHALASASLTVAYLTAFHWLIGAVSIEQPYGAATWSTRLIAQTGVSLLGLFALLAYAAEALAQRGLRTHAAIHAAASLAVACLSVMLVTFGALYGDAGAPRALLVYALYGAGCLVINLRWRRTDVSCLGLALLVSATLWAVWWGQTEHLLTPVWGTVLAIDTLLLALAAASLPVLGIQATVIRWPKPTAARC